MRKSCFLFFTEKLFPYPLIAILDELEFSETKTSFPMFSLMQGEAAKAIRCELVINTYT